MSNYRQRLFAIAAGAMLLAASSAWADKMDQQSVDQFQAQLNLAMKGNSESQYRVGEMYELGLGTQRDSSMAFLWYNKAATQGNAQAKDKLVALDRAKAQSSAEEQDRVNAAMRALQQQSEQEAARQKATAEATRARQADEAAKQKAAAEAAAAKAKAEAAARVVVTPKPAPVVTAPAPVAAPAAASTAASAAKSAAKDASDAEFSANPCKGPQAKFLSTCK